MLSCALHCIGESSFEIKTEADSRIISDYSEHPHDDMSEPCLSTMNDKRFRLTWKQHSRLHTQGLWYSCIQCEKRFSSRSALSKHKSMHESKHKCTECGRCCRSSNELMEHMRRHSGERPFECSVCSKRFTKSFNLAEHGRIHSGEKPYRCYVCNMSFSRIWGLKSHIRVHVRDKTQQWKRFSSKVSLCQQKNGYKYKCTDCGRCYRSSNEIAEHWRSHSGEKPFECTVCSKQFTRAGSLVVHSRIHSGEKPYECGLCPKAFGHHESLKWHMRAHTVPSATVEK